MLIGESVTKQCDGWGKRVSIFKYAEPRKDALILCEVFVIGYKYIGKCKLISLCPRNYINEVITASYSQQMFVIPLRNLTE